MQHAFYVHTDSDQCFQWFRDEKKNERIVDMFRKIIYSLRVVKIKLTPRLPVEVRPEPRVQCAAHNATGRFSEEKNSMKNVVKLGDGITLSLLTRAQMAAISARDGGLDYPLQGRGLRAGKFILPLWTDGDGGCYAIGRTGGVVELF